MSSTISNLAQNLLPKIGVTMGDPTGVGPEICMKLLLQPEILEFCNPVILGDLSSLGRFKDFSSIEPKLSIYRLKTIQESDFKSMSGPVLIDFESPGVEDLRPGKVSKIGGSVAYNFIDAAISWHQLNWIDAITTGPINKLALHAAGHFYPGHTEIFADRSDTQNYCMMQFSDELTCSFVTTHVGYAEVPSLLTVERILEVIQLSADAVRSIRGTEPRLIVCGLNPHAGEAGLFGNREEETVIAPAIELARKNGIEINGPFPPDTCFIPSRRNTTDCVVCMYHDQGHIPLKALVFDRAVNITLGLPIIRTSVDHGTAFDIVGMNQADPSSLIHAVKLAAKLALAKATAPKSQTENLPHLNMNGVSEKSPTGSKH